MFKFNFVISWGNRLEKDKFVGMLTAMLSKKQQSPRKHHEIEFGGNSDQQMNFFSGVLRP